MNKQPMTEAEIIEGNKLIAEFMGAKYLGKERHGGHDYHMFDFPESFAIKLSTPDGFGMKRTGYLEFDSQWDWIMEVVDDIRYARRFYTVNWNTISDQSYNLWKGIEKSLLNISLKQVFKAVVKFVTWYNQSSKA